VTVVLWVIPALITLLGLLPVALLARRVSTEVDEMRRSVGRFGELRPALVELRSDLTTTREAWEQLGRR